MVWCGLTNVVVAGPARTTRPVFPISKVPYLPCEYEMKIKILYLANLIEETQSRELFIVSQRFIYSSQLKIISHGASVAGWFSA